MARFPRLLNDRISGQIWLTGLCSRHPKVPEITAYMRRYYCNAGCFRGVRYDRHWDCYQVLIYRGSEAEWLFGDSCDEMMPGWGGNMYLPDCTSALIARDRVRQNPRVKWSPDIEVVADL